MHESTERGPVILRCNPHLICSLPAQLHHIYGDLAYPVQSFPIPVPPDRESRTQLGPLFTTSCNFSGVFFLF